MLAHGLTVGADRARQLSFSRHGASGQVIVIAGGLQLQQLEMLACGKQSRVYVAQDHVGVGDLLTRDGVGARVDKVLARSARLKNCVMAVIDGQQNQDVHKQSSPLSLQKRDGFVLAGCIRQNVQIKRRMQDGRARQHPALVRLPAEQLVASSVTTSCTSHWPSRCRPWCARTSRHPC